MSEEQARPRTLSTSHSLVSSFRKSLGLTSPSMDVQVHTFLLPTSTPEQKRKALYGIRDKAEKNKNVSEIISSGAIPAMVLALREGVDKDFPLWALWVIRFCAESSETATGLILQEPLAIESLIDLVNGAYVGSELAKRAVESIEQLSQHEMTLTLMAREDLFKCLSCALLAKPREATAALHALVNLSEMKQGVVPGYVQQLATDKVFVNLDHFMKHVPEKAKLAEELKAHIMKGKPAAAGGMEKLAE